MLVNSKGSPLRKRFTLAHELGHIVIPWHVGTIISHIDRIVRFKDDAYTAIEAEANRFASELLMPADWIQGVIQGSHDLAEVFRRLSAAKTSPQSMSIAAFRQFPAGYAYAEVDLNGVVQYCGRSAGTEISLPDPGDILDHSSYDACADDSHESSNGARSLHWWHFRKRAHIPSVSADKREWREILDGMLADTGSTPAEVKRIKMSLSGVIGAANGRDHDGTVAGLVALLKQRLVGRENFVDLLRHKDFETFLVKRAQGILAE